MKIRINDKEIDVVDGEKLIETARRNNIEIPTLCYFAGYRHQSSCMACVVKNRASNQIIPACSTVVTEEMDIDTESEEVIRLRTMSLELLLSDHRADCEAPCSMVCPEGLDIEKMLAFYDAERYEQAFRMLSAVFSLSKIACDNCKASCEKACRRGTIDKSVQIRNIIKELIDKYAGVEPEKEAEIYKFDKKLFQSRLGRFSAKEKEILKQTVVTKSRCLHCACAGKSDCKLRQYATKEGIKRPSFESSSTTPAMHKQNIVGNIWFEQAKCIKCGLCVYNSKDGFTFKDRGFGMQVILPDESVKNIDESLCEICPTGALYVKAMQ